MSFDDQTNLPKGATRSYITNCFIGPRPGENKVLFEPPGKDDTGDVIVRLDGYAVIPIEEYKRLKNELERAKKNK